VTWQLYQYADVYTEFCAAIREDVELQARIDQRLSVLTSLGHQAREPITKHVEAGILECRAKSARHQARLLFCFQPSQRIVILLAVLKDQRKLNRADIDEAKRRKAVIETHAEFIRGLHKAH
jgi:phage-related protein